MVKLDLGCGGLPARWKKGFVGVDIVDYSDIYPYQFIQADLFSEFPFDDNSIEEVYCSHFIEHIPQDKVIWFFNEIYRILISDRIFEILVPPTSGRGAWCDPTHRSYWNDLSFRYYDMTWCRTLSESYGIKCNFKQEKIETINEFNLHAILRKV